MSKLLQVAGLLVAGVLAVVILLTTTTLTAITAIGWLALVLCLYLASLLVP